jgi:membrane-associated phospholipid phosphatase
MHALLTHARLGAPLRLVLHLLVLAVPLSSAGAQNVPEDDRPAPILAAADAYFALGSTLGTLALAPLDGEIARALHESTASHPPLIRFAATAAEVAGGPGTLVLAGGMYVGGKIAASNHLATTGVRTGEAIVLAEILVYSIKGLAGRARPRVEGAHPLDFRFGRGIRGGAYQSFPSGHTAAAFAAAAVLTDAIGQSNPDAHLLAGSLLYSGAALTGLSRIYHSEHWLSDAAMGAAIGVFSGRKVIRFHRDRDDDTIIDRLLLSVSIQGGRPPVFSITPLPAR